MNWFLLITMLSVAALGFAGHVQEQRLKRLTERVTRLEQQPVDH